MVLDTEKGRKIFLTAAADQRFQWHRRNFSVCPWPMLRLSVLREFHLQLSLTEQHPAAYAANVKIVASQRGADRLRPRKLQRTPDFQITKAAHGRWDEEHICRCEVRRSMQLIKTK